MHTIQFASHVAYLDPMTGEGLLVCPKFADDLSMGGMDSLQAADWNSAMDHLRGIGWEPLEDEDGDGTPMFAGVTADGRDAIALYGHESITSMPSLMELAEAGVELASMAGVIPGWRD